MDHLTAPGFPILDIFIYACRKGFASDFSKDGAEVVFVEDEEESREILFHILF